MTDVAAIVPMRHDSERVRGKNYRPLGDRPLYHHILDTLLACPRIDRVIIDTDSDLIRQDAAEAFPRVEVVERPVHLRAGTVPMNDVLLNDVRRIDADLYLQTHSTNPFLRTESITRAIDELRRDESHDSLFGVTRLSEFGISHLSDNVILLQFLRGESRIRRALTVLKTRASSHDPSILEFDITSNGIELGERFADDQSFA